MKTRSVILILVFLSAVFVIVFGVRREEREPKAVVGLEAPDLTVSDATGKKYRLSELRGSVVFINFWATWCQPCREEMPSIQRLYDNFKNDAGFRMVTVLYKDDYAKATAYLRENNYGFPVLMDNKDKAARYYGVTGVPESYLVSKKGILKEKVIGPADWGSPQVIAAISNLIRE